MENHFEVDIEQEKVQYEGEWVGREELADKIKKMIDSQDFKIGVVGSALEYLQQAIANAKEFSVKLPEYNAKILQKHAERAGLAVTAFIRQAIQAYLAAQPPLEESPTESPAENPQLTTITTEPASPGEEHNAVELTDKKPQTSSTVLVDPALTSEPPPPPSPPEEEKSGDSWFKKES
jgi:ribbon-helix-helix CopG family protein